MSGRSMSSALLNSLSDSEGGALCDAYDVSAERDHGCDGRRHRTQDVDEHEHEHEHGTQDVGERDTSLAT